MVDTEIFIAGVMKPPKEMDGFSAPPKGFKHFRDASNRDPVEWAKNVITANFPAVTDIQMFHEDTSDMGGKMKIRFMYNREPVEFLVGGDEIFNTLTPVQYKNLAPHIQRMSSIERGLFNITLQLIKNKEQTHTPIRKSTHVEIEHLNTDITRIQSA